MDKIAAFNWSGGKDSTLALHYLLITKEYKIKYLVTTVNEAYNRIAMHGVREALLVMQADLLKIPLYQIRLPEMPDMETYEKAMDLHFKILKRRRVEYAIFGDIFLEDLRKYREQQFTKIGIKTVFPLWKRESRELVNEFIVLGYKTIVVCARADLKDLCGRVIDQSFIDNLPEGVDPCGENGEFHTFVFDGPIFTKAIAFTIGELVFRDPGFWYVDLIPLER